MKNIKRLKLTLVLLICILIILIGFVGIFEKKYNSYKNKLPDYKLASDLKGAIVLELEVDKSTKDIYYDANGKKVDESEITEENENEYLKVNEVVNKEENLTKENYKRVVEIMKQRLSFLQVDQYEIDLDENTGKIVLKFEDDYPEDIKSIIPMESRLQLVDSVTSDVILDYTDFTFADATYASKEDGSYVTYINLKLNSSGISKYNEIGKYKTVQTDSEEATVNKLKIIFDEDEISEIEYDNLVLTGKTLRVTTNDNITSNSTIQSTMNSNTVVAKLSTIGKLPVVYNITSEEYINSNSLQIKYIIYGFAVISMVAFIAIIIRYKTSGLLAVISFIANISLFLIIIRLTNIPISLNGFAGMFATIILNIIVVNNILKSLEDKNKKFIDNIKQAYLKSADVLVIFLIIFLVFAFSKMTVINSVGLLMFWGWSIVILGNLILTSSILSKSNRK